LFGRHLNSESAVLSSGQLPVSKANEIRTGTHNYFLPLLYKTYVDCAISAQHDRHIPARCTGTRYVIIMNTTSKDGPTHKWTEGRPPVWGSEFTTKAATLQGGSQKNFDAQTFCSGIWQSFGPRVWFNRFSFPGLNSSPSGDLG
jgi:hypothetical protein